MDQCPMAPPWIVLFRWPSTACGTNQASCPLLSTWALDRSVESSNVPPQHRRPLAAGAQLPGIPRRQEPSRSKSARDDASMTATFRTMPLSLSKELDALVKLQGHSGIVELLSWTETTFDVQFVFPLYKENAFAFLKRWLFRKQSGQPDLLRSVIKQLLRAIGHVHSRHILHRDVKTANLLLAEPLTNVRSSIR